MRVGIHLRITCAWRNMMDWSYFKILTALAGMTLCCTIQVIPKHITDLGIRDVFG